MFWALKVYNTYTYLGPLLVLAPLAAVPDDPEVPLVVVLLLLLPEVDSNGGSFSFASKAWKI